VKDLRFGMLLEVRRRRKIPIRIRPWLVGIGIAVALAMISPMIQGQAPSGRPLGAADLGVSGSGQTPGTTVVPGVPPQVAPRVGLSVVVLDPAHGGTDLGARGTEGIRESDVVVQFAAQTKKALEAQGFQVLQTREGNDNPSFDDRSSRANAQRGAVFISLHVASTGLAGTARVYVTPDMSSVDQPNGLIPWDRAQGPFVGLSKKLGDLVQAELAKRFKGSPTTAQVAPVRQLRTTAAPAIAVEISSVSVGDRAELDRMVPGVADAVARGVSAFKLSYVVPTIASPGGGTQP
jgi:N-acetylmuramoyl-L-alanine amidase